MRLGRIPEVEVGGEREDGDTSYRVTTRRKNYGSKWREPTYNLMKIIVRRRWSRRSRN